MNPSAAPRVSVIIPSYNHEPFVAEAIQSVLDQTCGDFEIVITDERGARICTARLTCLLRRPA